jgi:hypothetical protein
MMLSTASRIHASALYAGSRTVTVGEFKRDKAASCVASLCRNLGV